MFNFFDKTLESILKDFHSVHSKLDAFVTRIEAVLSNKKQQIVDLSYEVEQHITEVAKAKTVQANIRQLLGL